MFLIELCLLICLLIFLYIDTFLRCFQTSDPVPPSRDPHKRSSVAFKTEGPLKSPPILIPKTAPQKNRPALPDGKKRLCDIESLFNENKQIIV